MGKQDLYLAEIFKKIHVDRPENRNLFMKTKKAKEIFLYRGNNYWEPVKTKQVVYSLTMRCENACDEALEKVGLFQEYDSIIDTYVTRREEDDEYKNKLYNKYQDILYSNKKKIKMV